MRDFCEPDTNPPREPERDGRQDAEAAEDCPLCGGPRFGVHCKVICDNCGYREDCSDIFPVN